jgi:hypothetical protein
MVEWREAILGEKVLDLLTEESAKALLAWLRGVPAEERYDRIRALPELEASAARRREAKRSAMAKWREKGGKG